ncbi:MAG: hypothetical protein V4687_04835 [Bacteroidota bacterium]
METTNPNIEAAEPHGEQENKKSNYTEQAASTATEHPEEKDTDIEETATDEHTDDLAGDLAGNASGNDDSAD